MVNISLRVYINTLIRDANTGITIVKAITPIMMRVIVLVDPFSFWFLAIGCTPTFLSLFNS